MVTAELAVSLLVVVILMVAACWGTGVGVQKLRAMDLASQVARQEARGDHAAVAALAEGAPDARISIERANGLATVRVDLASARLGPLPALPVRATAITELEPGER